MNTPMTPSSRDNDNENGRFPRENAVGSHPEFVDAQTEQAVHWHAFWDAYAPVTPYGEAVKRQVKPFLPGFEGDADGAWQQLREDQYHWPDQSLAWIRQHLKQLPDVRDTLSTLTWSAAPLTPRHFLALKQFAVRGRQLCLSDPLLQAGWSQCARWETLTAVFAPSPASGGTGAVADAVADAVAGVVAGVVVPERVVPELSEQFSLDHLASPAYQKAAAAVTAALQRVAREKREERQIWEAATGSRLRKDGHVVIPLPSHKDLAEACKLDTRLKWLRDTPFESIFEVLPSADLAAALADLEEAKDALLVEEERLLTRLTERVRESLDVWERAVEDVADLDTRCAKVHMMRNLRGCVPEFGTVLELEDGVHPEVAERISGYGEQFTPVTLCPEDGVNVLFGSNMGGKTLSLSLLTACQMLAQYGLPVPAKSFHTRLFASVRFAATSGTDFHSGLSAYGSEVVRVSDCWRALTHASPAFVVFDEPVRSTNPVEGAALVTGLVRAAVTRTKEEQANEYTRSVVFVATHFVDPLLERGITKFRVRGLRREVRQAESEADRQGAGSQAGHDMTDDSARTQEDRLKRLEEAMDYRIERVTQPTIHQEALPIAEFLGAPGEWLREAKAFLREGRES